MTLKCWTSTATIGQAPASAAAAASSAAAGAASAAAVAVPSGNSAHAVLSVVATNGPRSAPLTNPSDMRRRSVGFISIPETPATAASPLVTTPSRNPNVHRPSRLRSLSSTWESADFDDDDDDDAEEKSNGSLSEQNRRDLTFTQIASSLNNQHEAAAAGGGGGHTPGRRRGHHSRSARSRRRRTMSESTGSVSTTTSSRRVRILTPVSNKVCFGGWVRGQPAEVQWEVVDKSVQSVRIDVCNVAWCVPTTIANRVPNDGSFQWKRVYWGMPITDGYYVNIYDVTDVSPEELPSPDQQLTRPPDQPSAAGNHENQQPERASTARQDKVELVLLARSDCFAVVG